MPITSAFDIPSDQDKRVLEIIRFLQTFNEIGDAVSPLDSFGINFQLAYTRAHVTSKELKHRIKYSTRMWREIANGVVLNIHRGQLDVLAYAFEYIPYIDEASIRENVIRSFGTFRILPKYDGIQVILYFDPTRLSWQFATKKSFIASEIVKPKLPIAISNQIADIKDSIDIVNRELTGVIKYVKSIRQDITYHNLINIYSSVLFKNVPASMVGFIKSLFLTKSDFRVLTASEARFYLDRSIADTPYEDSGELRMDAHIKDHLNKSVLTPRSLVLNSNFWYIFEFLTPFAPQLILYQNPELKLLTIRNKYTYAETPIEHQIEVASELGVSSIYNEINPFGILTYDQLISVIKSGRVDAANLEGFVLEADITNFKEKPRAKIKTPKFMYMERLVEDRSGENIFLAFKDQRKRNFAIYLDGVPQSPFSPTQISSDEKAVFEVVKLTTQEILVRRFGFTDYQFILDPYIKIVNDIIRRLSDDLIKYEVEINNMLSQPSMNLRLSLLSQFLTNKLVLLEIFDVSWIDNYVRKYKAETLFDPGFELTPIQYLAGVSDQKFLELVKLVNTKGRLLLFDKYRKDRTILIPGAFYLELYKHNDNAKLIEQRMYNDLLKLTSIKSDDIIQINASSDKVIVYLTNEFLFENVDLILDGNTYENLPVIRYALHK